MSGRSRELASRAALDVAHLRIMECVFHDEGAAALEDALIELAFHPLVRKEVPGIERLADGCVQAREGEDAEAREFALIELYGRLHRAGATYTERENRVLEGCRGIGNQPGGIAPVLMAARIIGAQSVVADLGAGNGLQGLLLERLRPHAGTLQIELSSEMTRTGRIFQEAMGIARDKVRWINRDMADVPLDGVDFVYIHRPAKPLGSGNLLYRKIADKLSAAQGPVTVLSIADCLGRFLGGEFSVHYENDLLTCFVRG